MGVFEAIRDAENLLPGEPVDTGVDPRWQAILEVGSYIDSEPEAVWSFIRLWGGHPQRDLRTAIATCLLEELLRRQFSRYFPFVEEAALGDPLFGDMVLRSWQVGQANEPDNALQFESLRARLRIIE